MKVGATSRGDLPHPRSRFGMERLMGAGVQAPATPQRFDRDYRALVSAARELGGPAWINAWFPAFAETDGDPGMEGSTDEELGALGELDIEGGDVDGPAEVSAGANGLA